MTSIRLVALPAICLLSSILPPPTEAQVVARQGKPEPVEEERTVEHFDSPMILELPLTEALAQGPEEYYFKGVGQYQCEGIGFSQLIFQRGKGDAVLVKSVLRSKERPKNPFHLRFEILADAKVLIAETVKAIPLEPSRLKPLETKLRLGAENLQLLASSSEPLLRITFTVDKEPGDFVKEIDEKGVASCEFLGMVSGTSMIGGLATEAATNTAVRRAKIQAETLGATHIVFLTIGTEGFGGRGQTNARAYRCPTE